MISTKPGAIARINRALAARYNVAWLSFLQDARGFNDVAGDVPLGAAGSQIDSDEGNAFRFNGSQSAQTGLVLPSSYEQIAVVARIRSTGSQGGNPGQAFGVANLGGVQCSIGVGYDSAGTAVGATVLHGNGANAVSTRSASIGTWYTVVAQGAFGTGSPVRAWVDGVPNTSGTNGGSGGAANTVVIGSQTRSAGTLRWFTGDVLWAAVLVGDTPFWMTDEIAADMWAQDFPYNLIAQSRSIWLPPAGGPSTPAGRADETDSALALSGLQIRAAGLSSEIDAALALAAVQSRSVGQATETDAALALAGLQARAAGLAQETDTAFALTLAAGTSPGVAEELDTALSLGAVLIGRVGMAIEVDAALSPVAPIAPTIENYAGGWFPATYQRRRTREGLIEERRALGIAIDDGAPVDIPQLVTQAVGKRRSKKAIDVLEALAHRPKPIDLTAQYRAMRRRQQDEMLLLM